MAWAISAAPDVWGDLHKELETWDRDDIIDALAKCVGDSVDRHAWATPAMVETAEGLAANELMRMSDDALIENVIREVASTDTTDNGGWLYWVDYEGNYKVDLRPICKCLRRYIPKYSDQKSCLECEGRVAA